MQLPEHLRIEMMALAASPAIYTWLDLQIKEIDNRFSLLATDVDPVAFKQAYTRLLDKKNILNELKTDLLTLKDEAKGE